MTRVLDIGCGQDLPLHLVLAASLSSVPKHYVGVDLNKLSKVPWTKWIAGVHGEFDFVSGGYKELKKKYGEFDLISCFEVIEHMHVKDGKRLLVGARELLSEDGQFVLSTPVYNRKKMAANHIHEWEIDELQAAIEEAGLRVVERFGTFASWNDIKRVCTDSERELLDTVARFYGGDVLACFLAPKYPDQSRNNAWVLKRAD